MNLTLYNSLSRSLEEFHPISKKTVGLYSCGPTVYWFAHIGNYRSFIFTDILRRTLMFNDYRVKHIKNITDVGHLTDDADQGEDKMIVAMRREGKTAWEIAEFYTDAFLRDEEKLNILPATKFVRATKHIKEQIKMIKEIEKNGYTYKTSDGIYFDTSKLKDYGRLSGQKLDEKLGGARVEVGEKRNATDFALWKFSKTSDKRQMEWSSPWGVGFPGWHIECSAMSAKYLGIPFDIHTGGIDHVPVHHENELAQTKAACDKLEANYWLHNDYLQVDNGKMSKSLGNLYRLDDLIVKGFDPLAFRYFCLQAHYRSKLNFTWEALEGAAQALKKLQFKARSLPKPKKLNPDSAYYQQFLGAVNNDLNTAQALSIAWVMLDDSEISNQEKATNLYNFDRIFGLNISQIVGVTRSLTPEVKKLAKDREKARADKDWAKSDLLRDKIINLGFEVEDTKEGQKIS